MKKVLLALAFLLPASAMAATVDLGAIELGNGVWQLPNRNDARDFRRAKVVSLGSTKLSYGRDQDLVRIPQTCNLVAVRLKTTGSFLGGVHVDRIAVIFANGQRQNLQVRENFRPGSTSRWIDLNGRQRCVTGFAVVGSSQTFFKNAKLKLEGLQQ